MDTTSRPRNNVTGNRVNFDELTTETGKMLVLLKQYSYKLYRKQMLERGIGVGRSFGDFKDLENQHLIKLISLPATANGNELLTDLEKIKADKIRSEINQLKNQTDNLRKTIERIKRDQQKTLDQISYFKWSAFIDESSMKYEKQFSEEFNELFDHLYKVDQINEKTLTEIAFQKAKLLQELQEAENEDDLFCEFLNSADSLQNNNSGFSGSSRELCVLTSFSSTQEGAHGQEKDEAIKKKHRTSGGSAKRTSQGKFCCEFEFVDEEYEIEIVIRKQIGE